mgnify:FL=1
MVFTYNQFEIKFLKQGKITKHRTTVKGKAYERGKIYLKDMALLHRRYELYELGGVNINEQGRHISGKGILIFFPDIYRKKE